MLRCPPAALTMEVTAVALGWGIIGPGRIADTAMAPGIIESGAIGDIILIQIEASAGANPPGGWRTEQELAGAASLNNIGVHPNDLLRYLTGSEVAEVVAMNDCGPGEWLDLITLTLFKF